MSLTSYPRIRKRIFILVTNLRTFFAQNSFVRDSQVFGLFVIRVIIKARSCLSLILFIILTAGCLTKNLIHSMLYFDRYHELLPNKYHKQTKQY